MYKDFLHLHISRGSIVCSSADQSGAKKHMWTITAFTAN